MKGKAKKLVTLLLALSMVFTYSFAAVGTSYAGEGGKIDMKEVFDNWVNYPGELWTDAGQSIPGGYNAGWTYKDGALCTTQNVGWTGYYNPNGFGMSVGTFQFDMKETAGHLDPQGWVWGLTKSGTGLDTTYSFYVYEECNCGYWSVSYIKDWKPSSNTSPHQGPVYHATLAAGDGDYSAHNGSFGRLKGTGFIDDANSKVLASGLLSDATEGNYTKTHNQLHTIKIKQEASKFSVYVEDPEGTGTGSWLITEQNMPAREGSYGPYTCSQYNAYYTGVYVRNVSSLKADFDITNASTGEVVTKVAAGTPIKLIDKSVVEGAAVKGYRWSVKFTNATGTVTKFGDGSFHEGTFDATSYTEYAKEAGTYTTTFEIMNEDGEYSEVITKKLEVTGGLKYDMNDGSSPSTTVDAGEHSSGDLIKVNCDPSTVPGYTPPAGMILKGWNTKADGSGTTYKNGESMNMTGATTLYAVWDASNSTKYVVEHYKGTTLYKTQNLLGVTGTSVTASPVSIYGYVFDDTKMSEATGTIKGDGSTVLKLYYNEKAAVAETGKYKVEYYVQDETGKYVLDDTVSKTDGTIGTYTFTPEANYKGDASYVVDTTKSVLTGSVTKDEATSTVYKVYYTNKNLVDYKVEAYFQDVLTGEYRLDAFKSYSAKGIASETLTKSDFPAYPGYELKTIDPTPAVIVKDGVIKCYYDSSEYVRYTINYKKPDGTLLDTVEITVKTGTTITDPTKKDFEGYEFSGFTGAIVDNGNKVDADHKVIDVNYVTTTDRQDYKHITKIVYRTSTNKITYTVKGNTLGDNTALALGTKWNTWLTTHTISNKAELVAFAENSAAATTIRKDALYKVGKMKFKRAVIQPVESGVTADQVFSGGKLVRDVAIYIDYSW